MFGMFGMRYILRITAFLGIIMFLTTCSQEDKAVTPYSGGTSANFDKLFPPGEYGSKAHGSAVKQKESQNVRQFFLTARQWSWSPDTITVSVGDLVRLSVKSIDIFHGLRIPGLGVEQPLRPGEEATVEFTVDKSGTYPFECSVICGAGHRTMTGKLVVKKREAQ